MQNCIGRKTLLLHSVMLYGWKEFKSPLPMELDRHRDDLCLYVKNSIWNGKWTESIVSVLHSSTQFSFFY